MRFKDRNLRALADLVVGNVPHFHYRSSTSITEFFEECDLNYVHNGSTRWRWTADRLAELLQEPQPTPYALPKRFVNLLQILMHKSDATEDDPDRSLALDALNVPLRREGYEAFYDEDGLLYVRHTGSKVISTAANPHRPFTPKEIEKREQLSKYLDNCSEDELTEEILLPLFRQLGFHRITAAGHGDKALEYGKDIWMRYVLPTQHVLYFGVQAKKDKIDSAGATKGTNVNVAELHHQLLMMLGHEIFDPETNRRVLVDHAFIVAGGEITKQARNWIGGKLDAARRSQILFMDREDILNLYATCSLPLPPGAVPDSPAFDDSDLPF
jgi:hypothetical protein